VLVDPPYALDPEPILAALAPLVAPGGWLVLETDARTGAPDAPAGMTLDRRRTYGGTALVLYRRGS
jgi:16S rRNA (guanine966-N2)-methyltransferase